jgi:hypothetical protein
LDTSRASLSAAALASGDGLGHAILQECYKNAPGAVGAERKTSNKGVNWSETTSGIEIGDIWARTTRIEDEGGRETPPGQDDM